MNDFFKSKQNLVISGIVIFIVIIGIVFGIQRFGNKNNNKEKLLVNEEIVPTVDSNVKVTLEESNTKGKIVLTVENAPSGTKEIDYQLTYSRNSKEFGDETVQEGVIGKCSQQIGSDDTWSCQKSDENGITLGTCSSGTCVYHEVVGDINVYLTFTGSYGQKSYEKNFNLE